MWNSYTPQCVSILPNDNCDSHGGNMLDLERL